MAIFWQSWMRGLFGGIFGAETGMQRSGPDFYRNEARQHVSDTRALQVGAVFRSIRIISEVAASLPMSAYKRLPNGDREELPYAHWLSRLIREPNETQTGEEWRESMFAQAAGWGNSYSQIVPASDGRPVELWPYKVDRMMITRNVDRTLTYQYPDMQNMPQILKKGRVFHMRMFSPDGVLGLSPLGMARESLGLTCAAQEYAASFFAQGGRPAGVLTTDKLLTDKQREQVKREYGGLADSDTGKRLWVMEAAMKYQAVTVSPEDMQMLQTRQFQISDIARFFGVPLFLLMETSKDTSWGTGLEQQNLGFLGYTLRAYLSRMLATWNRFIIPDAFRADIFVDIDVTPLLAMDSAAMSTFLSQSTQNAIMTRNEARRRLNLPRATDDNADALTCQSALTTLANLGNNLSAGTPPAVGVIAP